MILNILSGEEFLTKAFSYVFKYKKILQNLTVMDIMRRFSMFVMQSANFKIFHVILKWSKVYFVSHDYYIKCQVIPLHLSYVTYNIFLKIVWKVERHLVNWILSHKHPDFVKNINPIFPSFIDQKLSVLLVHYTEYWT